MIVVLLILIAAVDSLVVEKYFICLNLWQIDNHIEQIELDKWWDVGMAFGSFDEFEGVNNSISQWQLH